MRSPYTEATSSTLRTFVRWYFKLVNFCFVQPFSLTHNSNLSNSTLLVEFKTFVMLLQPHNHAEAKFHNPRLRIPEIAYIIWKSGGTHQMNFENCCGGDTNQRHYIILFHFVFSILFIFKSGGFLAGKIFSQHCFSLSCDDKLS